MYAVASVVRYIRHRDVLIAVCLSFCELLKRLSVDFRESCGIGTCRLWAREDYYLRQGGCNRRCLSVC